MNSLPISEEALEQGRAIARGMEEIQAQKQKNMARESRRMRTMIKNAAEKEMFK